MRESDFRNSWWNNGGFEGLVINWMLPRHDNRFYYTLSIIVYSLVIGQNNRITWKLKKFHCILGAQQMFLILLYWRFAFTISMFLSVKITFIYTNISLLLSEYKCKTHSKYRVVRIHIINCNVALFCKICSLFWIQNKRSDKCKAMSRRIRINLKTLEYYL